MKTFNALVAEINDCTAKIKELESENKALIDEFIHLEDIKARIEKHHANESKIKANEELQIDTKIQRSLLTTNARIALFNETAPVLLEELNKYAGKPYGEKTKEKIYNAFKARTNCGFYIKDSNTSAITLYAFESWRDYEVTIGTVYTPALGVRKPFLKDNKICPVEMTELCIYYTSNNYIEDIPARVEEIKAKYRVVFEKSEALREAMNEYNAICADLEALNRNSQIFETFRF